MRKKYEWVEWFRNKQTVIVRDVDYDCSQSTMSQLIRNEASKRKIKVGVLDTGESIVITVRDDQDLFLTNDQMGSVKVENIPLLFDAN